MLTQSLKLQIDKVWTTFWTGGVSNPLTVIEQITYLLFIRRLDELQILAERRANALSEPIKNPVYQAQEQQLRLERV